MTDPTSAERGANDPPAAPTPKERHAVQAEVSRLLEALAPERAAHRMVVPKSGILMHRSPRGAILQAPSGAVSVSWFADTAQSAELGELQVVAWHGTVSRPGSSRRAAGAEVVEQLVLRPVESESGAIAWRADDGTTYDTDALVVHCLALLERQMEGDRRDDGGGAPPPSPG